MLVVSFFGAPGVLILTVSRLTIGVSSGLGGRLMRTVSFFGMERFSAAGLVSEGSSSAINAEVFYLTRLGSCQTFAPDFHASNIDPPSIAIFISLFPVFDARSFPCSLVPMNPEPWSAADDFLAATLLPPDIALDECLAANHREGLPSIDVSPLQGKFLSLLAQIQGARRILEIGSLGGYSTIHLARALPAGGKLITLELDPLHARVARSNIARAGLSDKVELLEGPALDSLAHLHGRNLPPFDFIFIDADKTGYPAYLDASLKLARVGAVIVGDNVVRRGQIADAANPDPNVRAVRDFIRQAAAHPRLNTTVLQTVGAKGHDGLLIARVIA